MLSVDLGEPMICATKQLVKRYPRIAAATVVLCWFSAPFFAREVTTWWHYALVNGNVSVPPEIAVPVHAVVQSGHSALRHPWFYIGYAVWAAIALIAAHYDALRKLRSTECQVGKPSA